MPPKQPKTKVAQAIPDSDRGTTRDEVRGYVAYLAEHERTMRGRRALADVYAIASAFVDAFTAGEGDLVLTPENKINARETAKAALAYAFEAQNAADDIGLSSTSRKDTLEVSAVEAAISFDAGDTFPDQEALSLALVEVGESIAEETNIPPEPFPEWRDDERARVAKERAKRRGQR